MPNYQSVYYLKKYIFPVTTWWALWKNSHYQAVFLKVLSTYLHQNHLGCLLKINITHTRKHTQKEREREIAKPHLLKWNLYAILIKYCITDWIPIDSALYIRPDITGHMTLHHTNLLKFPKHKTFYRIGSPLHVTLQQSGIFLPLLNWFFKIPLLQEISIDHQLPSLFLHSCIYLMSVMILRLLSIIIHISL